MSRRPVRKRTIYALDPYGPEGATIARRIPLRHRCSFCGHLDHTKMTCPRVSRRCSLCKRPGHDRRNCTHWYWSRYA